MTIKEAVNEYLESLKVQNFSKLTIKVLICRLNRFLAFLDKNGIARIDLLTREIIQAYQIDEFHRINNNGRTNTTRTQNSLLGAVKGLTDFLLEREYLLIDPARKIKFAKEAKTLPKNVLSQTEMKKLLKIPDTSSAIGYRDRTILEVFYTSAIRKSELEDLTIEDVDYSQGIMRVKGKGQKERVVPIGRIACRYLENYIKSVRPMLANKKSTNHLFLSLRGNKFTDNLLLKMVKKYGKKAKLKKNVHPHLFRHSCATNMLKNNAPIRAIQELLGHTSLTSTQVYTKVTINDLKKVHSQCHPREQM